MSLSGPILLSPRLDPKPWGGRGLSRFGFELPDDEPIGEALITASEAIVLNPPYAGRTLGDLIAEDAVAVIGKRGLALTRGLHLFPLLIKILEANEPLSIQVHPTDETAPDGSLGKSEAWYVLDAKPGAVIYVGFADGADVEQLETIARRGESTAHLMRAVPVVPGMTISLPAGTVHALGAGVTIYEIQQPSAITYRIDDWGRVDAEGKSRELHLDAGLAVIDPASLPEPLAPQPLPIESGSRTGLVATHYFAAERIELAAGDRATLCGDGAPQVFTVLAGAVEVTVDGVTVTCNAGQSTAALANAGSATLHATAACTLLRGWIAPAS